MTLTIQDNNGEVFQSIIKALRREFDYPKTLCYRQIEIMNTTKNLDDESYFEMRSDLVSEGIIRED